MNNTEFISNLLFSNVEESEEKDNFIKAIQYVHEQSMHGKDIDRDEIDKILGLDGLDPVTRLGKVTKLITVGLNIRDEDAMIEKAMKSSHINIPEGMSEEEAMHIAFCCDSDNRSKMMNDDELFIENYLKFDDVSRDCSEASANKNTMILMMLTELIGYIYDTSVNENETINHAYKAYIEDKVPSAVTLILYTLLTNYMIEYHIRTVKELKKDVLGEINHFDITKVYPRIEKCNFNSIVEIINNFCYFHDTDDIITESNIDAAIKESVKEMIEDDIKRGEHRLEDIYVSYLGKENITADNLINIVIENIVEDIMENSSKSNFGSNDYHKDIINYTTNRYYDYSENSNVILVIYTTIMDFLVNNRNPYTYELFKEALVTLLKGKFVNY